jgi:hypothetical protein
MEVVATTFRRTSNQDRFIPLRGPAVWSGPFPVHLSELIEPLSCSPRNRRLRGLCATRQGHDLSV